MVIIYTNTKYENTKVNHELSLPSMYIVLNGSIFYALLLTIYGRENKGNSINYNAFYDEKKDMI